MAGSIPKDIANHLVHRLNQHEIAAWQRIFPLGRYRAGQTLFYRGHLPYGAMLLVSGTIEIRKDAESRTPLKTIQAPALVGLQAVVTDTPYPFTAVAATDLVVSFIEKQLIRRGIEPIPKAR